MNLKQRIQKFHKDEEGLGIIGKIAYTAPAVILCGVGLHDMLDQNYVRAAIEALTIGGYIGTLEGYFESNQKIKEIQKSTRIISE